ncbi:SGNH/GDSL hydrolase family protein [Nocardioidaceae bacterium]|nr:SGNH/GDSL hydrolase family protein [Nocardioidaceae bacterium]
MLALGLAGCSAGGGTAEPGDPGTSSGTATTQTASPEPAGPPSPFDAYAALGDSYTAAPLTPGTDLAGGCLRSTQNYPALLAEQLGVRLVDVSCSGADTDDVTGEQTFEVPTGETVEIPPQEEALTEETDLVTIGLGGNDEGIFGRITGACARASAEDCEAALDDGGLEDSFATVTENLIDVVELTREQVAEDAVVVLVGYPRLAPESGTCPELPVPEAALGRLDDAVRGLSDAVEAAAEQSDALFLDLYEPSADHDICAEEPWVNGVETVRGEALALHPFAVEQQAVAGLLEPLVRDAARAGS